MSIENIISQRNLYQGEPTLNRYLTNEQNLQYTS